MAVEAAAMVAAAKEEEEGKSPHPMRYIQCVDAGKKVRKHSKRPKTKHDPRQSTPQSTAQSTFSARIKCSWSLVGLRGQIPHN